MAFGWKKNKRNNPNWPKDVPQLYPQLESAALSNFLSEEEYQRMLGFPIVMALPLALDESTEREMLAGIGLSRILIRDLSLATNISVRGPEDTPLIPLSAIAEDADFLKRQITIGGRVVEGGSTLSGEFELRFPEGRRPMTLTVSQAPLAEFLMRAVGDLLEALEATLPDEIEEMLRKGRPANVDSLVRFGTLCVEENAMAKSEGAIALCRDDAEFVLPLHLIDDEDPRGKSFYLEGLTEDPFDSQLCFLLFASLWESRGHQPEAAQFLRRALELSPGHGKAHMYLSEVAHDEAPRLLHAELGYRLLPGNPFAVDAYIRRLRETEGRADQIMDLAIESLEAEPEDPLNYERVIAALLEIGDARNALRIAEQLQALYEPEMNERTRHFLQQHPSTCDRLRSGDWNPAVENQARIDELLSMVAGEVFAQ